MTTAELEQAVSHPELTEEQIADELYDLVQRDIDLGEPRDAVLASLKSTYASLVGTDLEAPRRAVREVIGFFYGYGAPEATF